MRIKKTASLFVVVCALAGGLRPVFADLKYTEETRQVTHGKTYVTTQTRYARPNAERLDDEYYYGEVAVRETTLNLCATNQQIKVDSKFLIYTVAPLPSRKKAVVQKEAATENPVQKTGKVVITWSAKPLGEETIAGVKAHGFFVTAKVEKSGCATQMTLPEMDVENINAEYWISDIDQIPPCLSEKPDLEKPLHLTGVEFHDGCKIAYEINGNENFRNIATKVVMRMKSSQGGKEVYYSKEITAFSAEKLADDVFTVPAFSKQVNAEEYQNARDQALRQELADVKRKAKNAAGD